MNRFFAPCALGLEYLLVDELKEIGAEDVHEGMAGVHFRGSLETAYRVMIWSRLASRVLLPLADAPVESFDELYELSLAIDWERQVPASGRVMLNASTRHPQLKDSRFASQRVKDAMVDRLREQGRERPVVDRKRAEAHFQVFVSRKEAVISVDLAGRSLAQRGYRTEAGEAPLREDLAAALLLRAGWPELAAAGGGLIDPMCGSGTLLIEAVLMAGDAAPGLIRGRLDSRWPCHDRALWERLLEEARTRRVRGFGALERRHAGYDRDGEVVNMARRNARRAGVEEFIRFEQRELEAFERPLWMPDQGLMITNPPYGERLDPGGLFELYRLLAERMGNQFVGWRASVFTADEDLAHAIPYRPESRYRLRNGPLQCLLVNFGELREKAGEGEGSPRPLSESAGMLENRLRKNLKKLSRYLNRNQVSCYRLYDADLPEYAAAIDVYEDHLHIQEYQAPATIPVATARRRLSELVRVAGAVMECPAEHLHVKTRRRQKGTDQYQRRSRSRSFLNVREGGLRFQVNLVDYLDSGLFLDHRETRARIRELARGRSVLNLFCYTGSITVYAAAGGASSTTSVDLSRTYLRWAETNMKLNQLDGPEHRFHQADCLEWLGQDEGRYDLIFLDPPTFSNSKRMEQDFDVQRDHVQLLTLAAARLADDGLLIFSNNFRRFELDPEALPELEFREITRQTVPPDFERSRPHRCWEVRHRGDSG